MANNLTYTYVSLSNVITDIREQDLNFAGNWSSGSTYFFGDVTLFNTTRYLALAASLGKQPPITLVRDNNWSALVLAVTGSFSGTTADAAAALSLANTAYGLATYAISIAGTGGGGGNDEAAMAVATAALHTAWKGTTIGLQAQAVASAALETAWTGTTAAAAAQAQANQANAVATDALTTSWTGTSNGAAAMAVATDALTTAWVGTNEANLAYGLATYAISIAGTASGSGQGTGAQGQADAAYALARAALTTAWTGTGDGAQANAVATAALSTAWTGTSDGAAAMAVATDALTTAWAGTSAGAAAMAVATDALTTAWTGTGNGAQANAVATDALSTAWAGTAAAAAAYALAQAAFSSSGSGTGSAAAAQAAADAAYRVATAALTTSWVGTGDGAEARSFASGAYDLAVVGTNAAAAALAIAVQGTSAGAALVNAAVANSIATSAYMLASTGTFDLNLGRDWVIDDFESYSTGSIDKPAGGYGWTSAGTVAGGGGSIVAYTMPDGSIDQRLSLAPVLNNVAGNNNEFIRQMPWGSKWHKIRIGALFRINGTATIPGGSVNNWTMGICSGQSGCRQPDTLNYLGIGAPAGNPATATYVIGIDAEYFTLLSMLNFDRRRNSSSTGTNTNLAGAVGGGIFAATGTNRLLTMLEINRVSYNDAVAVSGYNMANNVTNNGVAGEQEHDYGLATMVATMKQTINGASAGFSASYERQTGAGASGAFNWSETPTFANVSAKLDSVSIWSNIRLPIEISAIAVWRVR